MYDVIIIGGGIAGFSAAMYARRLALKTLVIEGNVLGGTITTTNIVENWPGIKKISGEKLAESIMEHAQEYGIDLVENWVKTVQRAGKKGCFSVSTEESTYECRSIIFATGAEHRKHPAKDAGRLENRGVHYCGLCDGPLYPGKEVAVIGGGDSAAKEALLLAEYAKKVYLLVKGEKLRGEPINNKRVGENKKIFLHTKVNVLEMKGRSKLESLVIKKGVKKEELKVEAAFVAIGIVPLSDVARKMGVKVNRKKEIMIDRKSQTNLKGVFACGDVTDTRFKQAITGAGEAITAAYGAYALINDEEYVCPQGEEK